MMKWVGRYYLPIARKKPPRNKVLLMFPVPWATFGGYLMPITISFHNNVKYGIIYLTFKDLTAGGYCWTGQCFIIEGNRADEPLGGRWWSFLIDNCNISAAYALPAFKNPVKRFLKNPMRKRKEQFYREPIPHLTGSTSFLGGKFLLILPIISTVEHTFCPKINRFQVVCEFEIVDNTNSPTL